MPTVRQKIIALLSLQAMDARELSREAGIREKEVVDHLTHIARSLASRDKRLIIQPSRCLRCGYIFADRRRLTRPGRCPDCKSSHLQNPVFCIR